MKRYLICLALAATPATATAQQWSVEGHGNYVRTTQTHQSSWGVGAQLAALWGSSNAPIQLSTSLGGDWLKQENSGPTTWSLSYDAAIQPGGSSAVTPYAGGSVSANWVSGDSNGALLGLNYILGVQVKPEAQGPLAIRFEARPGYVKTQEHAVTWRLGVSYSLK